MFPSAGFSGFKLQNQGKRQESEGLNHRVPKLTATEGKMLKTRPHFKAALSDPGGAQPDQTDSLPEPWCNQSVSGSLTCLISHIGKRDLIYPSTRLLLTPTYS